MWVVKVLNTGKPSTMLKYYVFSPSKSTFSDTVSPPASETFGVLHRFCGDFANAATRGDRSFSRLKCHFLCCFSHRCALFAGISSGSGVRFRSSPHGPR